MDKSGTFLLTVNFGMIFVPLCTVLYIEDYIHTYV